MADWDSGGESGQAHDMTRDRRFTAGRMPKAPDGSRYDAVIQANLGYLKKPSEKTWSAYVAATKNLNDRERKALEARGWTPPSGWTNNTYVDSRGRSSGLKGPSGPGVSE